MSDLSPYELRVLRCVATNTMNLLTPGAALWHAIEVLWKSGHIDDGQISPKGRAALQHAEQHVNTAQKSDG